MRWLLCFLLLPVSASALEVGTQDPNAFVEASKKDPDKIYALIIGATWCGPCKELEEELAKYPASTTTTVGRAVWNKVDVDKWGNHEFGMFMLNRNVGVAPGYPSVLAFRDGEGLGYSTVGKQLDKIELFLWDAEAYHRPKNAAAIPTPLCPGRSDWAESTLGISGPGSEGPDNPDDFGLANIVAFHSPNGKLRAFVRGSPTNVGSGVAAPTQTGVLYAPDALKPYRASRESLSLSTGALAGLAKAPGKSVRLVLTGHSGTSGLVVGTAPNKDFANALEDVLIDAPRLTENVSAARRAGKTVRGMILTCYGGLFGDAFLPAKGAPACAAFATLPEKLAEGCYETDRGSKRRDYLAEVADHGLCVEPGDGRRRHYAAFARGRGRDVPMLSSEYFLLFGPAAAYLGRGDKAPAPPRGIVAAALGSRYDVFLDAVGGGVIKTIHESKIVPDPKVSVIDCVGVYGGFSLDGKHSSPSFLRGRLTDPQAPQRPDCAPTLRFDWNPEDGEPPPSETVVLGDSSNLTYDPTRNFSQTWSEILGPNPQIDIRGLKPEARVLLKTVIPHYTRPLDAQGMADLLQKDAAETLLEDPELAHALADLSVAVRSERDAYAKKLHALPDALEDPPSPSGKKTEHPRLWLEYDHFRPDDLIQAMLYNIAPGDYDEDSVGMARLAHVAAVARAELALKEDAKTSPKAKKLLDEFESLVACERGLY